jgi:hypothetical protein
MKYYNQHTHTLHIPNKSGPRYVQHGTLVQSRPVEFMRDNGHLTSSFDVAGLTAQNKSVGNKNGPRLTN